MKKILAVIAAVFLSAAFAVPCAAADIGAAAAVLMDAETGETLYEKQADEPMQVASTTKIMTALVVLERCAPEETVRIPAACAGVEGSSIYLREGETLTVETLLYGMLLASGNDAAEALALYTAGSEEAFATLMNERAAALGCTGTHFVNPHGLDAAGHHATARDLALITAAAMENDVFRRIVATKSVTREGHTFTNHNKLLWSLPGCIGVKTGYTKSAGRSLVSCAERNGMRLICVTLDDPDDWEDHRALYESVFNVRQRIAIDAAHDTWPVPVVSGRAQTVEASPREQAGLILPADAEPAFDVRLKKFVYAPVNAGDVLGTLTVTSGGETLFWTDLVAQTSVAADDSQKLTIGERLLRRFGDAVDRLAARLGYEPEG